jgi:hypothetical protein
VSMQFFVIKFWILHFCFGPRSLCLGFSWADSYFCMFGAWTKGWSEAYLLARREECEVEGG